MVIITAKFIIKIRYKCVEIYNKVGHINALFQSQHTKSIKFITEIELLIQARSAYKTCIKKLVLSKFNGNHAQYHTDTYNLILFMEGGMTEHRNFVKHHLHHPLLQLFSAQPEVTSAT